MSTALLSSLSAVYNLSRNGSQLVQLGGDVSQQVDAAEQEASSALTSASVALNVVVTSSTSIVARNNLAVHTHTHTLILSFVYQTAQTKQLLSGNGEEEDRSGSILLASQQMVKAAEGLMLVLLVNLLRNLYI